MDMESDESDDIPLCRLNKVESGNLRSNKSKNADRNMVSIAEEDDTDFAVIKNSIKNNDNTSLKPNILLPIVFTKRLDEMDIFRNIFTFLALKEFLIDYVYKESKPKLTADSLGPQKVNITKSMEQFRSLKEKIKQYNKNISMKANNINYVNDKSSKGGGNIRRSRAEEPCENGNRKDKNKQTFLNKLIKKSDDEIIEIMSGPSDSDEVTEISYDYIKVMSTEEQALNLRLKLLNRFKDCPPSTLQDGAKAIEEKPTVLLFKYIKSKARSIFKLNSDYNVVESFTTSYSCYKQQIKNIINYDRSIKEDICCWYKMEKLSMAILDHLPNLRKHVQNQHRCDITKCSCCCRPIQKFKIVYNSKKDAITFDILHINTEASRNTRLEETIVYFMNSMEKQIELYEITMDGHISGYQITSFSDREMVLKIKERLSSNIKEKMGCVICCWQQHNYFLRTFLHNKLPEAIIAGMRKHHNCIADECKCCCYNLIRTTPNEKVRLKFDPCDMKHVRPTKHFGLSKIKANTELYYKENRNDTCNVKNYPPNYLTSNQKHPKTTISTPISGLIANQIDKLSKIVVNDKEKSQNVQKSSAVTKKSNTKLKDNTFDQKDEDCVSSCKNANTTLNIPENTVQTSVDQLLSSIISSKLSNVHQTQIQTTCNDDQENGLEITKLFKPHPESVCHLSKELNNSSKINSNVKKKGEKETRRPIYTPIYIIKTKKIKTIPVLPEISIPQPRIMTMMGIYNDVLKRKRHYLSLSFNSYKSCMNSKVTGLEQKFTEFSNVVNSEGEIIDMKVKVTQTEDTNPIHSDNTNSMNINLLCSDSIKRKFEENISQKGKKPKTDNLDKNTNVITSNISEDSDSRTNPLSVSLPQNNMVLPDHNYACYGTSLDSLPQNNMVLPDHNYACYGTS